MLSAPLGDHRNLQLTGPRNVRRSAALRLRNNDAVTGVVFRAAQAFELVAVQEQRGLQAGSRLSSVNGWRLKRPLRGFPAASPRRSACRLRARGRGPMGCQPARAKAGKTGWCRAGPQQDLQDCDGRGDHHVPDVAHQARHDRCEVQHQHESSGSAVTSQSANLSARRRCRRPSHGTGNQPRQVECQGFSRCILHGRAPPLAGVPHPIRAGQASVA